MTGSRPGRRTTAPVAFAAWTLASLALSATSSSAQGPLPQGVSISAPTLTTTNDATTHDVGIVASLGIQLSGTWSATVAFESTADGTNWNATPAYTLLGGLATQATANGQWIAPVSGLRKFRLRVSAYTSGTVSVGLYGSPVVSNLSVAGLTYSHSAVAVSTASTSTLGAGTTRRLLLLINDSDTNVYCNLAGAAAVASQGVRINANGGALLLDRMTQGSAVACIHSGTGSKTLLVTSEP